MIKSSVFSFISRMMRRIFIPLMTCVLMVSCAEGPLGGHGQVIVAWHTLTGVKEQALLGLIDQWNRTNPDGITVIPEQRTTAALHSGVLEGITHQSLPALMLVSPMQAALYNSKGILTPLNALMSDKADTVGWGVNDRADLYPFVLKAGRTADGKIVGIPFGGTVRLMLYNRDWLKTLNQDQAPDDWDKFTSACTAATDRTKGTLCFGVDTNSLAFEQWLFAHGGQVTTDDMTVLQVSTPAALLAMNRLAGFMRDNMAYRVTTEQQSRDDFATSRVLFMFGWSDGLDAAGTAIKQKANFDWGVTLLPSAGPNPTQTKFRAPLWVVPRTPAGPNPDHEKAAWLFIRWLMAEEQTSAWAAMTGELPSRISAINTLSLKQTLTPNQVILLQNIAPLAHPDPLISGWQCIENVLSSGVRDVFDGRSVTETLQLAQATGQSEIGFDCISE